MQGNTRGKGEDREQEIKILCKAQDKAQDRAQSKAQTKAKKRRSHASGFRAYSPERAAQIGCSCVAGRTTPWGGDRQLKLKVRTH